jgi:DNA-binding CsgD family transcriptional regulator
MSIQGVSRCNIGAKIVLTKREKICVYYLLRGMTARQIATKIFRSQRTVEDQIAGLKFKFNCRTKSELVGKIWDALLFSRVMMAAFVDEMENESKVLSNGGK